MKFNLEKFKVRKTFSLGEEIAHSITHGIGFLLGITALVLLAIKGVKTHSPIYIVSMMIYSASLILLYANSMFYHAFVGKAKDVFERLDHASIYLLIAGSYTPFCLIVVGGVKGVVVFAIQIVLAIIGVVFKSIWIDKFVKIHVLIYLLMGWMIVFFAGNIINNISPMAFYTLLLGGLCYSVGTLFYVFNWFKYHHFIWHLFVLAGSVLHFFSIYLFI